jgi:hypothetical protein
VRIIKTKEGERIVSLERIAESEDTGADGAAFDASEGEDLGTSDDSSDE